MPDQIESIDPATGKVIAHFAVHTPDQIEQAIAGADRAQQDWRTATFEERGAAMRRLAAHLQERRDD